MHNPLTRATLVACLTPQASHFSARLLSPDFILPLASSEFILPALYPRLLARNLLPLLPSDLAATLFAVTELSRERNLFILSDARSAIALLNRAGIEPIPLKGLAYLLAGIYPDPAERYLIDLDILIPESQLPIAIQALANAGYNALSSQVDPIVAFRHHAPAMLREGHIRIELHRSIGFGIMSHILPSSEIIAHSQSLILPDHPDLHLRLPSPEHLVTHLIIHSQILNSYSDRIWPPLRAFDDLIHLIQHHPNINWLSIEDRFRSSGQLATLKLHLLQLEHDFGFPPPFPIVLTAVEKLRWLRRRFLNRAPAMRFVDPTYLFMTAFSRRFRIFRDVVTAPGGFRFALRTLLSPSFYNHLWEELIH